ncbi:MAG: histidinol dehydrogenase [Gammaproteobacteria bacterium]|nr:MAG: histidinol dehydrogenase [Gammaproteobacteria bacterium]
MAEIAIARLDSSTSGFDQELEKLLAWEEQSDVEIHQRVLEIIEAIKKKGDAALVDCTARFDHHSVSSASDLELSRGQLEEAWHSLEPQEAEALKIAAERIRVYAEHQKLESWQFRDEDGTLLGQQIKPLDKVGVYVPGGKAAYPSSVLMNVIPAKVAGVSEIIMVSPAPGGKRNSLVMAAAYLAGVNRLFLIGGAQAIAALAWGTETVPCVDKIVGPGNIYVATAKKLVFGRVGIDMIAGPSEILIICDGKTDPDWIAADLFSQAEHDEDAQSILLSPDQEFLDAVQKSMSCLIEKMDRDEVIRESLATRGALVKVKDIDEAILIANRIAPEHLELSLDEPEKVAGRIEHAGAIFMGRYTAEAVGDYCAGPNHVLPTSGTARFSSPLGVYDFQKRSSLIGCTPDGASRLGETAALLARGEGLVAHAVSAEYRIKKH